MICWDEDSRVILLCRPPTEPPGNTTAGYNIRLQSSSTHQGTEPVRSEYASQLLCYLSCHLQLWYEASYTLYTEAQVSADYGIDLYDHQIISPATFSLVMLLCELGPGCNLPVLLESPSLARLVYPTGPVTVRVVVVAAPVLGLVTVV